MSIEELMKDEELTAKLEAAVESADKAQLMALLQEKGIEVTEAAVDELMNAQDAELSEEDLDNVAGGSVKGTVQKIWNWVKKYLHPVSGPIYPIGRK